MAPSIPGVPTHAKMMRGIAGEEKSPSAKKPITKVQTSADTDKPMAAGRGISCRIQLAEPHVYVYGLKPANRDIASSHFPPAIIRGKLILKVEKPTKIKAVTLNFFGQQRTEWPEGIPPDMERTFDEKRLQYQVLPFFNALLPREDDGYGAQCSYVLEDQGPTTSSLRIDPALADALAKVMDGNKKKKKPVLTASEQKRLSIGSVRSSSFEADRSSEASTRQIASKPQTGYKIFPPGTYEYNFEITLDHRCPETMNLPFGSVHWRLESLVERHGHFRTKLRGDQEVLVVRAPQANAEDQLSDPIDFTRTYDDLLCHVLIQGGAFPIGGKIPVQFTFTPLEKVEVRALWVAIVEETKYYCKNKLHSKKREKEVKIFNKKAGQPVSEEFAGSDVRFSQGGELSPERRAEARAQAQSLRHQVSVATGVAPEPLPEAGDNLLGDIDLGLDHFVGQTVMEVDLQLPTCDQMRKSTSKILHPSSSFKSTHVEHFIKFYLRTAKLQTDEAGVTKKVQNTEGFAIKITLLSCLATLSRTTLPTYGNDSDSGAPSHTAECGCPNANTISSSPLATSSRNALISGFSNFSSPDLQAPGSESGGNTSSRIRPIQMTRYPSYAPPPFNADQPPPSVNSPPPLYDNVVGTPSVDGLADYFARMANTYDDGRGADEHEDENESGDENDNGNETASESGNESKIRRNISRGGRVYISNPMSPGPRAPSHSFEINRGFMRDLANTIQEVERGTTSQPEEPQSGENTTQA
ncbi:hypothetical protein O988_03283 [Pseudogymnoascus sp. VKM F-3808]|nr:hypothetical protein O988_03283 [Pseudogymnoascus sp. VKM F-3808]